MARIPRLTLFLAISILALSACAAPPPPATPTFAPTSAPTLPSPQPTASPTAEPAAGEIYPAPDGYPAPTPESLVPQETYDPYPQPDSQSALAGAQLAVLRPETRYGIPAVDRVLDALFVNPADLPPLFNFINAPCALSPALGGPPPCAEGQAEGTLVEGLPVTGPEGHFLPRDSEALTKIPGSVDLLGVFQVYAEYKSEEYYPAGQYGIVLNDKTAATLLILRVADQGIVRLDYPTTIPGKEQLDLEFYLNALP